MIAAAMASVACTMIGPRMLGRMWRRTIRRCGLPTARGFDVVLDLGVEYLRPRQADKGRHRRDADRDHGIGEARAQEGGKRDGEDEEGTGEERIGDAHEEPVEEPADIARDEADRYAAGKRDADRDDAGKEGGPRSEDHPREHVAADLVGAEPMLE